MQNYNSKFKILPHTADLKIQIYGDNKKELFQNALFGMQECMKPEVKNKKKIKRKIKITSTDLPALLVDFLNEVLYLSQTNQEAYFETEFKKFTNNEIAGEVVGQKVERFGEDIKAATYHDLEIHQKKDKTWEAIILFDI